MIINTLIYGTIQSLKKRKWMFSSLYDHVDIDGIIYSKNSISTVRKKETDD